VEAAFYADFTGDADFSVSEGQLVGSGPGDSEALIAEFYASCAGGAHGTGEHERGY
jgi:hypothetical protein